MQLLKYREDDEIVLPRFSFKTNAQRPSFVIESFSRKSFSYNKLPQEPLTLTVLKLDGSSFVIVVSKMGTVEHLKQRVEEAFSHLPKRGPGMVSWSHVWGHFCLSYDDQRLLTDADYIGDYGIRDGDTLHFVRRVSVASNIVKEEIEETPISYKPTMNISSSVAVMSRMEDCKDIVSSCNEGITQHVRVIESRKNDNKDKKENDMGVVRYCRCKLGYMVRSWFSHQRLATSLNVRTKPSRLYLRGYAGCQESATSIY